MNNYFIQGQTVSEEDEKAFEMFMSSNIETKSCVAESLKEKLTSKKTEIGSRMSGNHDFIHFEMTFSQPVRRGTQFTIAK
jgi:hypothetical protein